MPWRSTRRYCRCTKYIDNVEVKNPVASITSLSERLARSAGLPGGRSLRSAGLAESLHASGHRADRLRHAAAASRPIRSRSTRSAARSRACSRKRTSSCKNNVLTLYAGKKVGDLALVWVSQEQGDAQIIGYIEGAPPAPMANLTNKPSYAGATRSPSRVRRRSHSSTRGELRQHDREQARPAAAPSASSSALGTATSRPSASA